MDCLLKSKKDAIEEPKGLLITVRWSVHLQEDQTEQGDGNLAVR